MFDGLKIFCCINDFEAWKRAVKIDWFTSTDLDTGATKAKLRNINGVLHQTIAHRADFETYHLTIKETTRTTINENRSTSYLLIVNGSVHKNHFKGTNYLPFTWDKLQEEITRLETALQVSDYSAELVNLEMGVNVLVPFSVFQFLQDNLISYKGKPFNRYNPDRNGICLGYVCHHSQYSLKIYDKSKQNNLPDYLMRFELRYLKMQTLKKWGIKTISDLKNRKKVEGLLNLLLIAWDNILLFDYTIDLKNPELKERDRELLENGNNPKFWEKMKEKSTRRFNYQRSKFRDLIRAYGEGWHDKLKELIKKEWENLFKNCTILPGFQNPELNNLTVKLKGKNGQNGHYKKREGFSTVKEANFPTR